MIRRAEIKRQLRVAQQLKVATLLIVAMLLLAAYPVYLFIRSGTQDQVFGHLDSLDLPSWAATRHEDAAQGSRWCIGECRFHSRTWASERAPDETNSAYVTALEGAGWRPRTEGGCPLAVEGIASCWKRDEYVMDMWVRAPVCDVPPPRPTISANPKASTTSGTTEREESTACPGALVTMQIYNAISYPGAPTDIGPSPGPSGTPSPIPTK
jgi:hypothetical protein